MIAADADAPPIPAIPRPELAAELRARAAGDPARLPELLALALDDEIPRCPPLGEPIARLVPPTSATIAARTEEALRGCGCAADVDRVLTLLHLLIAPRVVTVVSRPLALDPEGAGAITAGADRPWSELAPAAFEAGRTHLWLDVR
ncbi:MAG: hypothetical protein H6710_16235 [Myxococcales bacterium]|nr:hypothetical protein [Myxococcales bacterium]